MKGIFTSVLATLVLALAGFIPASAQWSVVGSMGLSNSVAKYTSIAVDGSNDPYIAYSDNSKGNKLTVEKYRGSSWSAVGSSGISSGSAEYISMAIHGSNIYVGFRDGSQNGKVTVMKYNGSSWSTLGGAGISGGGAYFISVAVNSSGDPYVAYHDLNASGKATVKKYNGSSWSSVGGTGFTTGSADYVDMCIDGSNNIYVAYRDNSNWYKARVMRYNGSSWSTLGNAGFSASGISDIAIAVDGNNRPYVVYRDWSKSGKATVEAYSSSSWSVVGGSGFSANGIGTPDIAIDGNNTPYVVYKDDGNNQKATVMTFGGSSWSAVSSAGFSANTVDYTTIAIGPSDNTIYTAFQHNAVGQKATVMKHAGAAPIVTTWTGNSSTNWNTSGNWSPSGVPASSDNVKIPAGKSRYPDITSGTAKCKNIEIASGAKVEVDGGTLEISGSITNKGTFDAEDGTIVFNGNSAQTISGDDFKNKSIRNFELDNSAGCTITGTLNITDEYLPTSGKMITNDKLVLKSTATRTARIGRGSSSGNYLSGKVTVERYMPGKRVFRFLSHPFGVAIPLSELTDDIDITGQGGTSNGFTQVQVNAPSAFWWDYSSADNSTAGNNPGWKDFPSAFAPYWDPYEMARILVRGTKGQGLSGNTYYPNDVTVDMTGLPNQGDKFIGLARGSNTMFAICGNPYQSTVNLKNVSRTNIYSNFCVWDPNQGTYGGYTAHQFSSDYYLPPHSAIVVTIYWWKSAGYLGFQESDKVSNSGASLFKGTADKKYLVELKVEDSTIFWDRLLIDFDKWGMHTEDSLDMVKLNNPDVDFYTISDDNVDLAIDARPYENNKSIRLGIMTNEEQYRYKITVPQFTVPDGTKLVLYDKYTNTKHELSAGFEYWFEVKKDPASFGNNRFEINMVGDPAGVDEVLTERAAKARMQLIPNPAHNTVKVAFDNVEGMALITIADVAGRVVYNQAVNGNVGSVTVPLEQLPDGMYIVEMKGDNTRMVEKLIKK